MPLGFIMASGTPGTLNGTFIRKRIIPVIPDDDVIQNSNIQHYAAILDLFGDLVDPLHWAGCCLKDGYDPGL